MFQEEGESSFLGWLCWLVVAVYASVPVWFGWSWFVVPLGAPAISFAHALGLVMLLGAARTSHRQMGAVFNLETAGTGVKSVTILWGFLYLANLVMRSIGS